MRNLLVVLACMAWTSLFAVTGDLSGTLIDKQSKTPLDFVNVSLFNKSEKLIQGAVSSEKGKFEIKGIPYGSYVLKVTFIGYESLELPIVLTANRPNLSLGTLILIENTKTLSEVTVTAQSTQMRLGLDKKVFDVGANIAAAGLVSTDVLRNIPSVDVDIEGNVSLRNNANVEIWINGKPSGITEDNRAQILQQMPAESIQTIEVITNPSAKYSPEGSAGIINIVLKKDRKLGYFGSVSAGIDTYLGYNVGANINVNSPNFDAYLNVGYRKMNFPVKQSSDRLSWNGTDTTRLMTDGIGTLGHNGFNIRGGYTQHLTDKDHLGLSFILMQNNHSTNTDAKYNTTFSNRSDRLEMSRYSENRNPMLMGMVGLDYVHDLGKEEEIRLFFNFMPFSRNADRDFTQQNLLSDTYFYQQQRGGSTRMKYEWQANLTKKIGTGKLETGYQGFYTASTSSLNTFEGLNPNQLLPQPTLDNLFNSDEQNHALFATYSGNLSKLNYQVGFRGDYTLMKSYDTQYRLLANNQAEAINTPFDNNYWGWFPSLFLSYDLDPKNSFQLNYTRRVDRPRGRMLSPMRDITDSLNISSGNPQLLPEYSNSIEFNYLLNWGERQTLSSSLYYRNSTQSIQRVSYVDNGIKYSNYDNIGAAQRGGLELISKNTIARFLDLTTTLNLFYYKYDGYTYSPIEAGIPPITYPSAESFSWNLKVIGNFMLPAGFSIQAIGAYNPTTYNPQGATYSTWSVDLGVRKSFFDRKLTVVLSGRDLFQSREMRRYTYGNNFMENSNNYWGGRMGMLTLSYNFGTGKNKKSTKGRQESSQQEDSSGGDMMDF